jgi:catechol 2,3-dioxygenase-like lactoylglutathione lyase family enzyme
VSTTLQAICGFQLTTADPQRLVRFYTEALGFHAGESTSIPSNEMTLLGVSGNGVRTELSLGNEQVELQTFDQPGRPYPGDASAADVCFQHFAIVTSDVEAAWARARAHDAKPISRVGVVALPRRSGGASAVKFRDPEGHPLELIQFHRVASSRGSGEGTLGIDHSAISVGDVEASRAFFIERGLVVGAQTLNRGPAQDALDGLDDVELDMVPMLPPLQCPHLELLGYRNPVGRALLAPAANDVAATRCESGACIQNKLSL